MAHRVPRRRRRILLHVLLLAGLWAGCDASRREEAHLPVTEPSTTVEVERARAEQAFERGDVGLAIEATRALGALLPETEASVLEIARLLSRAGRFSEALRLLETARLTHPESVEILIGIAETALEVSDGASARAAAESVPGTSDRHPYAQLLRAHGLLAMGDLDSALEALAAAVALYPGSAELGEAQIELLLAEGRVEQAHEAIAVMRARPELDAEARKWLDFTDSAIAIQTGDVEGALDLLESLNAWAPRFTPAWESRIRLLLARGDVESARSAVEKALEVAPDTPAYHALLAQIHRHDGDDGAAIAARREMIEHVGDVDTRIAVANALHAEGETEEARSVLRATTSDLSEADTRRVAYLAAAFLLDRDRLDEARAELDVFVARHGRSPESEFLRARIEFAEGDARAAALRLRWVLSQIDRSDVQHWLGLALEAQGDLEGAEYRFGLATVRNPEQIASHQGLVRVFERRGDWDRMIEAAARLVSIDPTQARSYEALARALVARGRLTHAEEVLRTHVERFPEVVGPILGLSTVLRQQRRFVEALEVLDGLGPLDAESPAALAERALVLHGLGRMAEARAVLAPSLVAGVEDASILRAWIFLQLMGGETLAAGETAERALSLHPNDPTPLRMLGDQALMQGDWARAIEFYGRVLRMQPDRPEVLERLGDAYLRLGHVEEAIAAYRRVTDVDDQAVRARNNLAYLLQQTGQLDEALIQAQMAYGRAPSEPVVMDSLGWLYLAHDRPERAAALLDRAHSAAPEIHDITLHLAVARGQCGEVEQALALLDGLEGRLASDDPLRSEVTAARRALQ